MLKCNLFRNYEYLIYYVRMFRMQLHMYIRNYTTQMLYGNSFEFKCYFFGVFELWMV